MSRADILVGDDGMGRCAWSGSAAEYLRYHDEEWGQPIRGDQKLYEKLCLEGFQAGLSWITILRRREGFRAAFHGFDPQRVAVMTPTDVDALMQDTGIIRNRAKIEATIQNARITEQLTASDPGALDRLIWSFAPPARKSTLAGLAEVPAVTAESTALSSALRALGYRFVGPTTTYALMQAGGMVDDHVHGCWKAPVFATEP